MLDVVSICGARGPRGKNAGHPGLESGVCKCGAATTRWRSRFSDLVHQEGILIRRRSVAAAEEGAGRGLQPAELARAGRVHAFCDEGV